MSIKPSTPRTRYARRRGSQTLHIVTGVAGWYSGMTAVAECGVKHTDVLEDPASRDQISPLACKRCLHTLGWDLS